MFYCTVLLLLAATADVFGHSVVGKSPQVGIVGGDPVSISEVPYMARLRFFDGRHLCGATIVHERFVLTAAHCCVDDRYYPLFFEIYVGSDKVSTSEKYDAEDIKIHKKYTQKTYDYDICLVKLSTELSPNVTKVELADERLKLESGMMLNATGWGIQHHYDTKELHDEDDSSILRQVSLPFVNQSDCVTIYENMDKTITDRMICAGIEGKGHCYGDSGGPLTWNNVQVGIISWGETCSRYPGVNTKVSVLRPWIKETIASNI